MTTAISLVDQFASAIALVDRSNAVKSIATVSEYEKAKEDYKALIQHEKELDKQYNELQCVIDAKLAQAQKKKLSEQFDAAKKYLKNTPMLKYEQAEEAKRQAEERRLAAIAQAEADRETARLVAEQKAAFDKAEKERKAAEAIAAKTKDAEKRKQAEEAAQAASDRAEQAKQEAMAIRADAAAAPAVVVVVERTAPSVTRRMVPKFRVTNEAIIPRAYFSRDDVKIGGVVRSLRANHGIPGIEYYEELA